MYADRQKVVDTTPKRKRPFLKRDFNAKIGNAAVHQVSGKFGLAYEKNECRDKVLDWLIDNRLVDSNTVRKNIHMVLTKWTTPKHDWLCSDTKSGQDSMPRMPEL